MRNQLSLAVTIALLVFSLGVNSSGSIDSVSSTTTVIPPPTNPQTTNATLEYDLTNRLTDNGTTCTYGWGPLLTLYRTGDSYEFNFSSTSPIDVYAFFSDTYKGTISCALGPILYASWVPEKRTGEQGDFGQEGCLGCEQEGGVGTSHYVLFINHDPTVTPHVTLQVGVKLYHTTTTTTVSPSPSAIPFMGVPEILLAILLGLFVVTVRRRNWDWERRAS